MKYPLLQIAACFAVGIAFASCASERTVTTTTKRDPMMQHFAGNFETKTDKDGIKRSGSDRRSSFENKSYSGTKDFSTKSYGKKEFRTKDFAKKEFGRESFEFGGKRNVKMEESDLGGKRFTEAGKVADTDKQLFDRNKEIEHTPFGDATKAVATKAYYPAEKSQRQGDAVLKGNVRPYESPDPLTFGDIKSILNRGN